MLQGQLRQYEATAKADQQLHRREVTQLTEELSRLKQQNVHLSAKCRRSEGLLLEQTLLAGDGSRGYQMELAEKQRALVALESELQSAKEMNAHHLDKF